MSLSRLLLTSLLAAAPMTAAAQGDILPFRHEEKTLANGLKVVQPLTLMSHGLYNKPRGAFLPSILF